ncbi:MAG: GNAT family N-acetyltransferase [Proteobacteria bacterium]|nr:GNAT family N-acetyltransferase [Pseudomonadota bacterium]
MFIRSERLFLRPGWPEDWEELLAQIGDERVVKNLARAPWPYTPDDARHFASQPQDSRCPHFLITLPTSAEPARIIGSAGLAHDGVDVQLGYWIARDHWGKGFATEAARAVLRLARTLGHRKLVAKHFTSNQASGRVLRKIGFRPTGEIRPAYSLALGEDRPAVVHTIHLGQSSDCDGDGSGGASMTAMRAA